MTIKIKHKRGTASAVASANPTPAAGELVFETDTRRFKLGDGSTAYTSLAYVAPSASDITSGTLDIARIPTGSTSSTVCIGNDARLSDTRTPTDGSVSTAKLANDAVTYAKLQNVSATDRLLGRSSAGAGDVEEITCTSFGRSLIDDADAAAARTTLSVQPTASPAFTGAATFANTGDVVPLTVTNTGTVNSFVVNDASPDTTPFVIDASGNVGIKSDTAAYSLQIAADSETTATDNYIAIWGNVAGSNGTTGGVRFFNRQSNASATPARQIAGVYAGRHGDNFGGSLTFLTSNAATGTQTLATRLTIDSTGTATFAGQVLVAAGSVSACSVAASGDPNTGLTFPAADNVAWVTGGVERMRVKATGSVRFVPLSADPASGNEAGDVYYNSSTNKLRVYNGTSWVDLH